MLEKKKITYQKLKICQNINRKKQKTAKHAEFADPIPRWT